MFVFLNYHIEISPVSQHKQHSFLTLLPLLSITQASPEKCNPALINYSSKRRTFGLSLKASKEERLVLDMKRFHVAIKAGVMQGSFQDGVVNGGHLGKEEKGERRTGGEE